MKTTKSTKKKAKKKRKVTMVKRIEDFVYDHFILFQINIIIMMSGRIPDIVADFIAYAKQNLTYMQVVDPITHKSNAERLGVDPAKLTIMAALLLELDNTDPAHLGIIQLRADPMTKGPVTRKLFEVYVKKYNDFYHPCLDSMAASGNLTTYDRGITHIVEESSTHHTPQTPIADKPHITAQFIAPGVLKLICRSVADGVTHKPLNCDLLEITYVVVAPSLIGTELTGIPRATAPVSGDDCTYRETRTKTRFNMIIKGVYSGLMLYGYVRYNNAAHPNLAGLWSDAFVIKVQ